MISLPLTTLLLVILTLIGAQASVPASTATQALASVSVAVDTRPNIVLILADDLDIQLGSLEVMPNLKALLAAQGASFDQAFVPISLCCPSRASLLRGQYPHNHGVYTNGPPTGGFQRFQELNLEDQTLATALQGAGYRTALLGKYLNGYPDPAAQSFIPPGWSEWYSPSSDNAYSEYNYSLNENGTLVAYGDAPADYLTDVLAAKANSFVTRTATTGEPFFIELATYAPHLPYTPAPRHVGLFAGVQAPRPPSFNEADVSDKPAAVQGKPLLNPVAISSIDTSYRLRLQSLQAVDELIAGLVQTLAASGELDSTYIFFTSDNGYHMGAHRLSSGKYTPYEEDIRVPLLVRGPGVSAGVVRRELVSNIDLAPTFAEIAGLTPPAQVDGRSLVPLLQAGQSAPAWRQAVLFEQYPFAGQQPSSRRYPAGIGAARIGYAGVLEPLDPQDVLAAAPQAAYQGLRTATYKYVEYSTGERELYDLVADPYELQNLAAGADPALLAALKGWLNTYSSCAGAGCRSADALTPPILPGSLSRYIALPLLER
ncbi:MAG: sulfatase [Roseiflexaceae bacterium]|nr:sulfatase [Roseiflexaceae bacterium]